MKQTKHPFQWFPVKKKNSSQAFFSIVFSKGCMAMMMGIVLWVIGFFYLQKSSLMAQQNLKHPETEGVKIVEQLNQKVPLNLVFTNRKGETITLEHYFSTGEEQTTNKSKPVPIPVVLSLVYFDCPMMCNFVLNGMLEVFNKNAINGGLKLGEDYRAVTVSFDPKDTSEKAARVHQNYFSKISLQKNIPEEDSWDFLVGNQDNISALSEAVGFYYRYLDKINEYSHNAAIYVLSPTGKITRYLYGIQYKPFDVKLALLEAKDETARSSLERFLLYCYRYRGSERGYVLHAVNAMKIGGLLTVLILGSFLILMFLKEKSKNKNP